MGFENYVDDDEIRTLYLSARGGDRDAEKALAQIMLANIGPADEVGRRRTRAMTPREQKADRAYKILYWLRQNTQ